MTSTSGVVLMSDIGVSLLSCTDAAIVAFLLSGAGRGRVRYDLAGRPTGRPDRDGDGSPPRPGSCQALVCTPPVWPAVVVPVEAVRAGAATPLFGFTAPFEAR